MKSGPCLHTKFTQKVVTAVFAFKVGNVFQASPKSHKIVYLLFYENCSPRTMNISQSGHTVHSLVRHFISVFIGLCDAAVGYRARPLLLLSKFRS